MKPFIDNSQKERLQHIIALGEETFGLIHNNNPGMAAMLETAWAHAGLEFCRQFRDELSQYSKELALLADNQYLNWADALEVPEEEMQLCLPLNEPK